MADQSTLYSRWLNGELSEEEKINISESGEEYQLENVIKALDLWEKEEINLDSAYQKLRE